MVTQIQIAVAAGLFLLGVLSGGSANGWRWEAKYNNREAQIERLTREHVERAVDQANANWEEEREILADGFRVEREVEYRFIEIEKEVQRVETPECNRLGDQFIRVLNDRVDLANRGPGGAGE